MSSENLVYVVVVESRKAHFPLYMQLKRVRNRKKMKINNRREKGVCLQTSFVERKFSSYTQHATSTHPPRFFFSPYTYVPPYRRYELYIQN